MEKKYSTISKILYRSRLAFNKFDDMWTDYVNVKMSRDRAKRLRKKLVAHNGESIVDRKLLKQIKSYSQSAFGSSSYWPWLAYYTELRGSFKEGWIPDDYYRFSLLPELNPYKYATFSEAKSIDHKLFKGFILDPLLYRANGQYYSADDRVQTKSEVDTFLADVDDEIIIKPDNGRGGHHIIFAHSKDITVDKLPSDGNLLFQKVVKQHPELSRLYPHSVNTLRVFSYLNSDGEVNAKFIIIRFGTGGARVDNTSSGGGWIYVNLDGKTAPIGYDGYGVPIGRVHPDTRTIFADLELSFVPEVVEFCKRAHLNFPHTRIIGWDVFVDKNQKPKLIEWNANNPYWNVIEAHFGPFLKEIVSPK